MEVEVLYHQSVTDVFEGKVPLTKDDAVGYFIHVLQNCYKILI